MKTWSYGINTIYKKANIYLEEASMIKPKKYSMKKIKNSGTGKFRKAITLEDVQQKIIRGEREYQEGKTIVVDSPRQLLR